MVTMENECFEKDWILGGAVEMMVEMGGRKTVQFKFSLDSLGENYQLNHWKELNLRRQPLSLLTSAQSEIVSSAPY